MMGPQASIDEFQRLVTEGVPAQLAEIAGVDVRRAPDADSCGATGCRGAEEFFEAAIDGAGERVLCVQHLVAFVRRHRPAAVNAGILADSTGGGSCGA